ncbi:MAG: carboxylesterase family protein, partial [Bacteroidales bacterium]|nr:carboxylesterase family protein [Bacteroidales bacterium]
MVFSACCDGCHSRAERKAVTLETSAKLTTVNTQSGPVAGYIEDGVYTYKGIPYAKAERFMAPTDPEPWTDVRPSRAYGPTCPQDKRA